jgi:hypothetical protein
MNTPTFSTSHYRTITGDTPRGRTLWTFKFCLPYKAPVMETTPSSMSFSKAKDWAMRRAAQLGSHRVEVAP